MKIDKLAVVVKCSDGKIRQIYADQRTKDMILSVVASRGEIKIHEEPIDSIDLQ